MKYAFSTGLFTCCVLAFCCGLFYLIKRDKRHLENRLFFLFCMSSALWSLGFGGIFIQTDSEAACRWRAIGLMGVFLYFISSQMLICILSDIAKRVQNILNAISLTGIGIYVFLAQKDQAVFHFDDFGLTHHMQLTIWNILYIIYLIIVFFNIMGTLIYILRTSNSKRMLAFCRRFLLVEFIIILGLLFDAFCPLLNMPMFPAGAVAQFIGFIVLYYALNEIKHSRITVSNMSEFLYYSLAMPVLVYDSDKKLRILNDSAHTFFDIDSSQESFENIQIQDLFDLDDTVFEFEGNQSDIDATCSRNWLYCNLAISKIHDSYGDTNGYIILVTDLSERLKTMQDLEEATIEAKCASEAKTVFLANMSHEIRTPMNAIIGFSELILKMELSPEVKEYVQDIKSSSHNLLAIINDILDISKIESGKMEVVCADYYLTTLLRDVALIISNQAQKKNLEFIIHVDPSIPNKLYGDKIRIRGILVNILNNAVKYTKEGHIRFDVRLLSQTGDDVTLEFKISDTGIGIKKENLATLFQSFAQLDQSINYGIEGSGLGLAIVKGYITLMHGDISVESTYGEGSTFTVTLPQKAMDTELIGENFSVNTAENSESSIGNMKISGIHVLVVDDNPVNLKVAGSSLRYYGLTVDTANSGKDAIALCETNHYDIVFLDHMMPEMDGVETMKHIRKIAPKYAQGGETKIIVLTANAVSGVRNRLMEEGFDEYLGKPINYKQMERLFVRFLPKECISYEDTLESAASAEKSEDIDFVKDTLTNVDIAQGMENCGGHLEDYLGVLEIAWKYGGKNLEELLDLYKKKDFENYTIKVHSMKSMAKNLGADDVSDMARLQEEAGKQNDLAFIDAHVTELQTAYIALLEKVKAVLLHFGKINQASSKETAEELPAEQIQLTIRYILNCLDEFEFTKVFDVLESLQGYMLPEGYKEMFTEVERLMDDLDIDSVRTILEKNCAITE